MIELVFSFSYNSELEPIFYRDRDLSADLNMIINAISTDMMFMSYKIQKEISLETKSCRIKVEGLSGDPDDNFSKIDEYFNFLLRNKLILLNLASAFHISNTIFGLGANDDIFRISSRRTNLHLLDYQTNNELAFEKMLYDTSELPQNFFCSISAQIMDLPCYNIKNPEVYLDRNILLNSKFSSGSHPLTRKKLSITEDVFDLVLADQIRTTVEKVKFVYDRKLSYKKFQSEILNLEMGDLEFKELYQQSELNIEDYLSRGQDCLKKGEYINALYCFKKSESLALQANVYLRLNKIEAARNCFDQLIQSYENKSQFYQENLLDYSTLLIHDKNYELAEQIIQENSKPFKEHAAPRSLQQLERNSLLAYFKVQDNYHEHCKAFRRAASRGDCENLLLLLNHFPGIDVNQSDTVEKKRFTPLHLAIQENHLLAALLLVAKGADVDKKDAHDVTPKDLAERHKDTRYLSLLSNAHYIQFTFKPNAQKNLKPILQENVDQVCQLMNMPKKAIALTDGKSIFIFNIQADLVYINLFVHKLMLTTINKSNLFQNREIDRKFIIENPKYTSEIEKSYSVLSFIFEKERPPYLTHPDLSHPRVLGLFNNFEPDVNYNDFKAQALQFIEALIINNRLLVVSTVNAISHTDITDRLSISIHLITKHISPDCAHILRLILNNALFQQNFQCTDLTIEPTAELSFTTQPQPPVINAPLSRNFTN